MEYTVSDLNLLYLQNDFVLQCDKRYYESVNEIANAIIKSGKTKVFVCGPSGAGKTTATESIYKRLIALGKNCLYISMDNYFHSIDKTRLEKKGFIYYEEPARVDFELFNRQLLSLSQGESVYMPSFDFSTKKRSDKTTLITPKKDTIIITEGIHSLNNNYIEFDENCFKIFVNATDTVVWGNVVLHDYDIRLLRRFSRDKNHRNRTIEQTANFLLSVEIGKKMFIDPFAKDIDVYFNTFVPYELGVFKDELYKDICNMPLESTENIVKVLNGLHSVNKSVLLADTPLNEYL